MERRVAAVDTDRPLFTLRYKGDASFNPNNNTASKTQG
jgi:hypothetical protein